MHWILRYHDAAEGDPGRREALRPAHLRHARDAAARGELLLAGAVGDPPGAALLLFVAPDAGVAEAFAHADPYVVDGVVTAWTVERWLTVVGDGAAMPVRPD